MKTKAGKDAILDGQQTFFNDLNKVESAVERKQNEFIMKEFQRLGEKIVVETSGLQQRLETLE